MFAFVLLNGGRARALTRIAAGREQVDFRTLSLLPGPSWGARDLPFNKTPLGCWWGQSWVDQDFLLTKDVGHRPSQMLSYQAI